jgi:hypothetical protein
MPEALTASAPVWRARSMSTSGPSASRTTRWAASLAGVFMPAGASLDYFVHGNEVMLSFLPLRLLCALLLTVLLAGAASTGPDTRYYRVLGPLVMPCASLSIAWMIYMTDGAVSPYYAGLNLVMLGSAILLRWTFGGQRPDVLSHARRLCAGHLAARPVAEPGSFSTISTSSLSPASSSLAGSWLYNNIRRSEFDLRYRLDENRAELEAVQSKAAGAG